MASLWISAPGEEVGIRAVVSAAGAVRVRAAATGSPTPPPSLQQEEQQGGFPAHTSVCRVQTCPCHGWSGQGPILHTCISTIQFCLCSREAREGTGALAPSSTRVGRNLLSGWWHPYRILSGCFTQCCDTQSSPRRMAMVRDDWGGKRWETETSTEQHRERKSPWKGEESPRTLGSSV